MQKKVAPQATYDKIKDQMVARQGRAMRLRSLLLLLPLAPLTGCVVTYGNFPDVTADALPKHHTSQPISYYVDHISTTFYGDDTRSTVSIALFPNLYPLNMKDFEDKGRDVIGTTLENSGMFPELHAVEVPPIAQYGTSPSANKGIYIGVSFEVADNPSSAVRSVVAVQMAIARAGLLPLAWTPIPYYSEEGSLRVRYQLYREDTSYAMYEYTIKKKGAGGLLLLPLAWLNFFTDDLKDALRATTLQFLIDAHRNGNL